MYGITKAAHALGNNKPAPLLDAEDAFWRAIGRIASGSFAEREMRNFINEFQEITDKWENLGVLVDYSFFDNGMLQQSLSHTLLSQLLC
jgi:hypothetical protein